ncbi:fibrobacter succinogenes major paralogous domain-containing protein [Algibacter mikhailovii]|uniref:fibrobacter succinogenes major paralogous domain-containing protein n=1 Tax=Algibacter mikhailovii TaxID=425498 RepID=UPI002493D4F2|nr:fibrobacter succinogenes major paralogous domain-containing protein [Algibacter mikhailovii]
MNKIPIGIFLVLLGVSCKTDNKTLVDVDGNMYKTVRINNTIWMAENLRTKRDSAGGHLNYFFPNGESANLKSYGLLYDFENACKACPKGWRVPSSKEWEEILEFTENNVASKYKDNQFWKGEENSNSSNFSVRPAGIGNNQEHPNNFDENTLFWSNSKEEEHFVWTYIFERGNDKIRKASQHPTYAFSVRCIRN